MGEGVIDYLNANGMGWIILYTICSFWASAVKHNMIWSRMIDPSPRIADQNLT